MDKFSKSKQSEDVNNEEELLSRREYLLSLKKWSKAVIAGVLVGGMSSCGGSWVNASGGGWGNSGVAWVNRRGGWSNRGGSSWRNSRSSPGRGGGSWGNRR